MNKACHGCGRIVTVPDIPLPPGYTQKCTACGFNNPVEDELPPKSGGGDTSLSSADLLDGLGFSEDSNSQTWESTFDNSMDDIFRNNSQLKTEPPIKADEEKLLWKFEQKLRDLETKIRSEVDILNGNSQSFTSFEKGTIGEHPLVNQREILVGTLHAPLYQNCEAVLKDKGYVLHAVNDLGTALSRMLQNYFGVLIFDQKFLNSGDEGRKVFKCIKATPLAIRRCQTVIMISPGISTCESQVFYQWGIDLNIHPKDLDRLDGLLAEVKALKKQILTPYLASLA